MAMYLAKLFQFFPMAFFNLAFSFVNFQLHMKHLEFLGVEDQRLRLILSEIIFAIQEIHLQYPDPVVFIALGISFINLRYIRYKWALVNTLACLPMTNEMAIAMLFRMVAVTSATVFVYIHVEFIRLMTRPPEPEEEIPMQDLILFLEETERMELENNNEA